MWRILGNQWSRTAPCTILARSAAEERGSIPNETNLGWKLHRVRMNHRYYSKLSRGVSETARESTSLRYQGENDAAIKRRRPLSRISGVRYRKKTISIVYFDPNILGTIYRFAGTAQVPWNARRAQGFRHLIGSAVRSAILGTHRTAILKETVRSMRQFFFYSVCSRISRSTLRKTIMQSISILLLFDP